MAKHTTIGGQITVGTGRAIAIHPGYSVTLSQGLNGPIVITNGHGINLQGPMDPCTITSFDDHFDVVPLGGDQVAADMEV